jgi:TetR/AcrR family acrAB operon transcriptional repressor
MSAMATRRIEQTKESRRLLLAAAAELFAERGYRRSSFIDIAERAGISRGSIAWHFGNKLGLLEAVFEDQAQLAVTGFPAASEQLRGAPLDRLMDFIRTPATRLFITLIGEAMEPDSPLRAHYTKLHAAMRKGVRAHLPDEALPKGADPEALAVVLVGVIIGIDVQWRIAPEAVDLDAVQATLSALLPKDLQRP